MSDLGDQEEKYRALEKTWLAANQQFIAFQVLFDLFLLGELNFIFVKVIHRNS